MTTPGPKGQSGRDGKDGRHCSFVFSESETVTISQLNTNTTNLIFNLDAAVLSNVKGSLNGLLSPFFTYAKVGDTITVIKGSYETKVYVRAPDGNWYEVLGQTFA